MSGELYLANNPQKAEPLPDELDRAWQSETAWTRRGAVDGLRRLLAGDNPGGQKRLACPSICRFDFSACTPITKQADGVLSFGTLLPKNGEFVYLGLAPAAGTHLAHKDINDAKGIPGIGLKFEPDNQRDEGDPSAAPDAVRKAADDLLAGGVDAIIGPGTSPVARNVIDKITCSGVVMFPPSNTAPLFTAYPDHDFYCRTASSSEFEGEVLGKLVAEGKPTVVLISRDDEFGNPLREVTGKAIQESGGRVLDSINYDPKRHDYTAEVQRIKGMNPGAIVVIGFAETLRSLPR